MRFAIFLTVVLSIWLAEHLYVGHRLLSLPVFSETLARRLLMVVMVAGFLAYFAGRFAGAAGWRPVAAVLEYGGGLWMGVVFLLLAAFVVADIATLGGYVLGQWLPLIRSSAAVLALLAALLGWVGGWATPRVIRVDLPVQNLPADSDGLTLLQISDLHVGAITSRARLRRVQLLIDELRPDVLAITGDLVDGDARAVEPLLPELSRFTAPRGVFAVLGNHEYYAGPARSRKVLRDAGWTVLDNVAEEVAPGVVIAGVPDARGASQTGNLTADLSAALAGVEPEAAVVLLQHSPGDEEEAAAAGVDLMLNGHTHGGQIWPFHFMVARAYSHYAGIRQVGAMTQVVSRGAGLWGPPMRLFAPADVVLVTLRPVEPEPVPEAVDPAT